MSKTAYGNYEAGDKENRLISILDRLDSLEESPDLKIVKYQVIRHLSATIDQDFGSVDKDRPGRDD